MDELLHHCVRELAFDGDLGSDVSRLKDFIKEFYAQRSTSVQQNCDDSLCSFIWSLVVHQCTVLVGLVPAGITSEVWVAPQISAKRKAQARGEESVSMKPPELDPIPNATHTPLHTLVDEYGDRLRIAVDPDAIFAAITGSHIRSSKLSPMVYTALQIITRGRETGVTVVELGKKSGYDQKTCFYLVRQLTELDLVVKVRRGGVGTHFCIHRYFFERNMSWKAIRDEENEAEHTHSNQQTTDIAAASDEEGSVESHVLSFTPIDARHLSSLPLVSGRVIKLLKASKNNIHASNNMLITLGFSNPTKTDRRFFQSRIREMIQQGLIEKVVVPSNRGKSLNTSVKCFRLVQESTPALASTPVISVDPDEDLDDVEGANGVKLDVTIHKQIIDLLEDSGTTGMTLSDLSLALDHFDRRTVELLLARADKLHPPLHLSDLRIAGLMENSGRERRHRYYTVLNYQKLVSEEALDKASAGYNHVNLDHIRGFYPMNADWYFERDSELIDYQDAFKGDDGPNQNKRSNKRVTKNPILPDGTVKKGRPAKQLPTMLLDIDAHERLPAEERPSTTTPSLPKALKRKRMATEEVSDNDSAISGQKTAQSQQAPLPPEVNKVPPRKAPKPKSNRVPIPSSDVIQPAQQLRVSDTNGEDNITRIEWSHEVINGGAGVEGEFLGGCAGDQVFARECDIVQNDPMTGISPAPKPSEGFTGLVAAEINPRHSDGNLPLPSELTTETTLGLVVEHVDCSVSPTSSSRSSTGICTATNEVPDRELLLIIDPKLAHEARAAGDELAQSASNDPLSYQQTPQAIPPANSSSGRVNVSHLRRENELLRVVENFGGIVNIQGKEFFEAHMQLLEALSKVGEPMSAPVGTRTDKRTAASTFNSLESKGRVKQLKTSVTTHTGAMKSACIIYLPTTEQKKINAFLADLARGSQPIAPLLGSYVKINERVEYGADPTSTSRGVLPLQLLQLEQPSDNEKERWSKNISRAQQLFKYDDATVREVFLAERTTLSQLYGFIIGKALRCRELHLSTLRTLESDFESLHIVSRGQRVIDISFFCHDIPLHLHCSLVSPLAHDDELLSLFTSEEGQHILVRDLPPASHSLLQIGRSRSRSRFLDMLEILRSLNLVTPLRPSTSTAPFMTCNANGKHPTAFDRAPPEGWSINTPMAAPTYWHFHETAPIHVWSVSETQPPFWKNVKVSTYHEGSAYWRDNQTACSSDIATDGIEGQQEITPVASVSVARSLRRGVSWQSQYFFTWHQTQYLRQFIDIPSANTPLQTINVQEREAQLEKIGWVTSAPQQAIADYFNNSRQKLLKGLDKARRRLKPRPPRGQVGDEDHKAISWAKRAEEARIQKENHWDELLSRIHPNPLPEAAAIRIERVQTRFIQTGSIKDSARWESEIQGALRESQLASNQAFKLNSKRPSLQQQVLPTPNEAPASSEPSTTCEATVQDLIVKQGPAIQHENKKRRRGKEDKRLDQEPKKITRRHRFQWNQEFDELARDASAIIRARCRHLPRLDWAAFEQVFPAVPRNTVRQRVTHLRETPGSEAYLRRLEDSWHELWIKHRGTPLLPDHDRQSPSNFDLLNHVEFLRAHIDKSALRVGHAQVTETVNVTIPPAYSTLAECFEIQEPEKAAPEWDFMWNALIEEGRERKLKRKAITLYLQQAPLDQVEEPQTDVAFLAEAALKMVMGTPLESYSSEHASGLLRSRGEGPINHAARNLLIRGILSKSQRDPTKQKPGRQLKISESNQNAISGSISNDTFQDAASLLDEVASNDVSWHEWPLTATDGDCATLIQLVSENKVDLQVDTSLPRAARHALDWNSKKADDDQIETSITVRYRVPSRDDEPPITSMSPQVAERSSISACPESTGHDIEPPDNPACRKGSPSGPVDCFTCLNEAWLDFCNSLDGREKAVAIWLHSLVVQRGASGVKKTEVGVCVPYSIVDVSRIIKQMTEAPIPLLFWTGYDTLVLVSSRFLSDWTVLISNEPTYKMFPRRWLDIRGAQIANYWQAAQRAVISTIVFRPGISQTEVRWRLRSVYDRQEVYEVLRYLQGLGHLQMRFGSLSSWTAVDTLAPFDEEEEASVHWFIGDNCWYQV